MKMKKPTPKKKPKRLAPAPWQQRPAFLSTIVTKEHAQ